MPEIEPWRLLVPAVLALAATLYFDAASARRGLLPPGFRRLGRRVLAAAALAVVLFRGVFLPLGMIGLDVEVDLSAVHPAQLFALHLMMIAALLVWFFAGFARLPAPAAALPEAAPAPPLSVDEGEAAPPAAPPAVRVPLGRRFAEQLGFLAPDVGRELGIGVVLGLAAWLGVLAVALILGLLLYALGGEELLPKRPPDLVPWIAGLPIALRVLASLSAGVVEETFFRGFLQPRIGLLASTVLFVLAHASYGQPFMLVGVTLLSLIYGLLVRWRQSLWAAIAAHVLFDAIQLLVVIPAALRMIDKAGAAG